MGYKINKNFYLCNEVISNNIQKIAGTVVHGRGDGRKIGYPTANIDLPPDSQLDSGVYLVRVTIEKHGGVESHFAVASVGVHPTFEGERKKNLECFLLDFNGDLYGKKIIVDLLQYIRPELRFGDVDDLIRHIEIDIQEARQAIILISKKQKPNQDE